MTSSAPHTSSSATRAWLLIESATTTCTSAAIKSIQAKISTIDNQLADTLIVLGADRLDADLAFYNYLDFAARTGAAGAAAIHSELKAIYPSSRRPGPKPPKPPTP